MSENTKDPFPTLQRRSLFITQTTPSGVALMPSDKSNEAADERFSREGGLRVPTASRPAENAKRGRGRPKVEIGYPGPDCGLSRAQWYRRQREAKQPGGPGG